MKLEIVKSVVTDLLTPLYESPRYNSGLQSNPGHVVIIFTQVAVTNGARRYERTA